MIEYRIRYYWYGTTYFDYVAELPPYAKILTESPMQTAEEISHNLRNVHRIQIGGADAPLM